MYRCRDLPEWKHPNGRPYHETLKSQISRAVSAELFHSDHSNVVLPPSVHALDGFVYRWKTFGESWKSRGGGSRRITDSPARSSREKSCRGTSSSRVICVSSSARTA